MATIQGTNGHDNLEGTAAADTIDGRGGFDTLYGRGGDDSLSGAQSYDSLEGGEGNDTLIGEGPGVLNFEGGDDTLSGGSEGRAAPGGSPSTGPGCGQPPALPARGSSGSGATDDAREMPLSLRHPPCRPHMSRLRLRLLPPPSVQARETAIDAGGHGMRAVSQEILRRPRTRPCHGRRHAPSR